MAENARFNSKYFRVNVVLIRPDARYNGQRVPFHRQMKFKFDDMHGYPCVLRVAATVAIKLFFNYPHHEIKALLITNIPADDTLPTIGLQPYCEDTFYPAIGRSFDLDLEDNLYVRFSIFEPHMNLHYTYIKKKDEYDYLPKLLNRNLYRNPHLLNINISQLHICTNRLNYFGAWNTEGPFRRLANHRG